jgi:hypothetical protein
MNTIENNKIIAEFMGLSKTKMFFNLKTGNYVKNENDDCKVRPTEVYLKNNKPITMFYYHKDWNWLMEVVEKIESLENTRFDFQINQYNVRIYDHENIEFIVELNRDTKIEATYNACVEFIKWYNEQNK